MTNQQLQKVLRLMRSTKDRVVVLDNTNNDVVVLLPLEQYEDLLTSSTPALPRPPEETIEEDIEYEEVPAASDAFERNLGEAEAEAETEAEAEAEASTETEIDEEAAFENQNPFSPRDEEQFPVEQRREIKIDTRLTPVPPTLGATRPIADVPVRQIPINSGVQPAAAQPALQSQDFSNSWAQHNSNNNTEDLTDVPEEPEEQFYLEPIE
jgi:PHD/YefM family antitoxin component YafN of YafNO toxin-antitoxin module